MTSPQPVMELRQWTSVLAGTFTLALDPSHSI